MTDPIPAALRGKSLGEISEIAGPIPPDQITQELLPCPFCGAPGERCSPDYEVEVHCSQCAAKVEAAPEFWNRRALSRQPEAGVMREYVKRAAEILAPHSGDAPGMPTREALVMVNAALFPQARDRVPLPAPQPRDDDAAENLRDTAFAAGLYEGARRLSDRVANLTTGLEEIRDAAWSGEFAVERIRACAARWLDGSEEALDVAMRSDLARARSTSKEAPDA